MRAASANAASLLDIFLFSDMIFVKFTNCRHAQHALENIKLFNKKIRKIVFLNNQ